MSKRKREETGKPKKQKSCSNFKQEWLSHLVESELPSREKQKITIWDVFIYQDTDITIQKC